MENLELLKEEKFNGIAWLKVLQNRERSKVEL